MEPELLPRVWESFSFLTNMAIVKTNDTIVNNTGADPSFSFDCSEGNYLVVIVYDETDVDGATYNSVAMTERVSSSYADGLNVTIFTLASPASGSNTLAVDMTSGGAFVGVVAFRGVDIADAVEGTGTDTQDSPGLGIVMNVDITEVN